MERWKNGDLKMFDALMFGYGLIAGHLGFLAGCLVWHFIIKKPYKKWRTK